MCFAKEPFIQAHKLSLEESINNSCMHFPRKHVKSDVLCLLKIELKFLLLVGRERNRTGIDGKGSAHLTTLSLNFFQENGKIFQRHCFAENSNEVYSTNILRNHLMSARETVRVNFRRNLMGFSLKSTIFKCSFVLKIGNRCVVFFHSVSMITLTNVNLSQQLVQNSN